MIIEKIRLKNIKAFGDGPDQRGHVINLSAGLNLIQGRNGSGKTTILEAIGLCLFGADPREGQKISLERYLLRNQEEEGEIEIAFSLEESAYSLMRHYGGKSRSKLYCQGELIAEGEGAVATVLAQLFGVPSYQRLSLLFEKLIGVGQGRVTRAFELKASEQQAYFNPLFEVERFAKLADALLEDGRDLKERIEGVNHKIELAIEKLKPFLGARERWQERLLRKMALENELAEMSQRERKGKREWEALQQAESEYQQALQRERALAQLHVQGQERLNQAHVMRARALIARAACQEQAPGKEAYEQADRAVKKLERELIARTQLFKQRDLLFKQALQLQQLLAKREEQIKTFEKTLEKLAAEKKESDLLLAANGEKKDALGKQIPLLQDRAQKLAEQIQSQLLRSSLLKEIQSAHAEKIDCPPLSDLAPLEQAQKLAVQKEREIAQAAAEKRAEKNALMAQLKQIAGGICPFLKETCRQFDAQHVSSEEKALELEASMLERERAAMSVEIEKLHGLLLLERQERERRSLLLAKKEAQQQQIDLLEKRWEELTQNPLPKSIECALQQLKIDLEHLESTYAMEQEALKAKQKQELHLEWQLNQIDTRLQAIEKETLSCQKKLLESQKEMEEGAFQLQDSQVQIAALDQQIAHLNALEDDLLQERLQMERHRDSYHTYLAYAEESALLEERQRQAESVQKALIETQKELEESQNEVALKKSELQPERKATLAEEIEALYRSSGEKKSLLKGIDLVHLHEDMRKLTIFNAEIGKLAHQRRSLKGALYFLETARKVYKQAGPQIASILSKTIASRAEQIYNAISLEAIQIRWDSANYSLKVQTMSGEKLFKMLSGGEQTKVALSMVMAMITQFSHLKICLFDEPTYGVDKESREQLVDQIKKLLEEYRFDQLILISHDSLFDQEIEHAVHLKKGEASGSSVS
ncbi:MAG: hypothetical protein K0S07_1728 [Chlamydiales bacterium]|jgi:exonuclease SbcC|nr:hypothetical protein [Chlamydiales bacterium]